MELILVRHGQTPSNVQRLLDTAAPGASLDETGHQQAAALVGRLAGDGVEAIYTSGVPRTEQTAAPLAARLGITPVALPGLREVQAGRWEMSTDWVPYVKTLTAWQTDPTVRIPDSENGVEFVERFDAAVRQIADDGAGRAVVVSHGAALRVWTGTHCAAVTPQFLRTADVPNTTVIRVQGSPSTGWELLSWGDETL